MQKFFQSLFSGDWWFNFPLKLVDEVPQNMYHIPSAEENIMMEMPQKISIYTLSAALGHNGISIIIFL